MSKYTTGELAKECGVSVRTVQFYDTKGLLHPTEITEGGRRLYTDQDMKTLRLICMLKAFGLSLDSIKGILQSEHPNKVLQLLLGEQTKRINIAMEDLKKQQAGIAAFQAVICNGETLPVNFVTDIEHMMNGTRKLRNTRIYLLCFGSLMDLVEIGALLLWILKGIWWPFAVGMPLVIVMAYLLARMYYRNTAYLCPECGMKFQPAFSKFVFSRHTAKTRKLRCIKCGYHGYCVETYSEDAG